MDSSFEDVLERIETGDDHEIEQIMDAVHKVCHVAMKHIFPSSVLAILGHLPPGEGFGSCIEYHKMASHGRWEAEVLSDRGSAVVEKMVFLQKTDGCFAVTAIAKKGENQQAKN